jgi:hypothetical protein
MLVGTSIATPAAAASFDGQWNVQIASTRTACPNGASVSIGITDGKILSSDAMMSASGHVADACSISVTLTTGIKQAIGSGHLTARSGTGHGAMCSGAWNAQRI